MIFAAGAAICIARGKGFSIIIRSAPENAWYEIGIVSAALRDFLSEIAGKFSEVSRNSPVQDALELIRREPCEHVAFCGVDFVARDLPLTVDHQSPL